MIDKTSNQIDFSQAIPLLPLRDVVVFPNMVIPLFVGRPKSIKALEDAMEGGKNIVLAAQKDASLEDPVEGDVFDVGILASILQLLKLPDGTVKVLVEGEQRVRIERYEPKDEYFSVIVTAIEGESVDYKQLKELESNDISEETLSVIYTGLNKLLRSALRLPLVSLKQEVGFIRVNTTSLFMSTKLIYFQVF